MSNTYVILGAGGFARELMFHVLDTVGSDAQFIFVDDVSNKKSLIVRGVTYPVVEDWDFSPYSYLNIVGFLVGIGDPNLKEKLVLKAIHSGLTPAKTIIHPKAIVQDKENNIGFGGLIGPGCILTTNVTIGNYVILNLNCTVGHDATLSDFCTANPGCHISGNTYLHKGVTLGTGTTLREKITISAYVTTGAQSCVVKSVDEESIVVTGVPAKQLIIKMEVK